MPYLIGTDEAGYGPNLGPLVISATVWEVPSLDPRANLYRRLSAAIVAGTAASEWGKLPLAIADSKLLYQPSTGLATLERGVQTCLCLLGGARNSWQELWQYLEPARDACQDELPWHAEGEFTLPLRADGAEFAPLSDVLREALDAADVRLIGIKSRCVFPGPFNEMVTRFDNKAEALSRTTLALVAEMLYPLPPGEVRIVCDKHGGRNRYGPLLQQLFPDVLIEVRRESREVSTYRWGTSPARREIVFMAGGESALPTALASMVSKYVREVSMHCFNAYWRRHLPELRPTAGYPGDSRRFKSEIAAMQQSLGIADAVLWRDR